MKIIKNWLVKWEWFIIAGLAIISFVLGFIGYSELLETQKLSFSLPLITYWTFQLYLLNASFTSGQTNILLDISRFLAPALFFFTAFKAGWQILKNQVEGARLKRLKDHVIICGLGEKGIILAEQFKNDKVVVIDLDINDGMLQQCEELGVYPILGNVTSPEVLRNAGIDKARCLIAVCGDDGVNTQIWANVSEYEIVKRREKPLDCYIHIKNTPIFDNLREQELIRNEGPIKSTNLKDNGVLYYGARLHFFNTYVNGAVKLLSEFSFTGNEQGDTRILVVGLGNIAESFVIQAAKNWHNDHLKQGSKEILTIKIIAPKATSNTKLWNIRYPSLATFCRLEPYDMDIDSAEFHNTIDSLDFGQLKMIFICIEDDVKGVAAALTVNQKFRGTNKKQIVLCVPHEKGLAQMISRVTNTDQKVEQLKTFGFLKKSCHKDLIMTSDIDLIAQALHQGYLTHQIASGKEMSSKAVMQDWSVLNEDYKEENYRQARSIHSMLQSEGYGIKPRCNWDTPLIEFSLTEIDIIAEKEHERWKSSREQQGWSWGEQRDNQNKKNPLLKSWDLLTKDEKDTTRQTVRNIPQYLVNANYEIFSLEEGHR